MPDLSFAALFIVVLAGFAAPFLPGLAPRVRLPAVVLEIVLGMVSARRCWGGCSLICPIEIISIIGLAFLLFLSGMEVDLDRLHGRLSAVPGDARSGSASSCRCSSSRAARSSTCVR